MINKILCGDALDIIKDIPDKYVNCVVTSPPYYGLRDYGHDGQIGLEETPEMYVEKLVKLFREVHRVLRDDGTMWLNLGDSYSSHKDCKSVGQSLAKGTSREHAHEMGLGKSRVRDSKMLKSQGLKNKDLIGIPWMVAFALRADGWYLRQDIIWCLSGGTWLYVKTQKGEMPMMVKDVARLDPSTVKLWNGEKWTQLLGMNKSARRGNELEIVLRSGERISCTPTHKFPAELGLIEAKDIRVGDVLQSCKLPEPESPKDCVIDNDAAWLAGLYIAEGSMSEDTIQIAGHSKELERWDNVRRIATKYGGSATRTISGNNMSIRIYGKILVSIISELVSGTTSHDKGFANVVWKYSNSFIESMLDGYLSGDGHEDGGRWRLGFCRNYNLERDLRTACARLGFSLTLNMSSVKYGGGNNPTFRGELRKAISRHRNNKNRNEVVEIRKSRCRNVWDIGVEDEPHLFALASGVLTHNSKPNPMPESVTDRCTKAHEYIFLLSKSAKYYYDAEAIVEDATGFDGRKDTYFKGGVKYDGFNEQTMLSRGRERWRYKNLKEKGQQTHTMHEKRANGLQDELSPIRNKRSVWTVTTKPYKGAHFATYPQDLIKPCILAGCPESGIVFDPFMGSGTTAIVARKLNRNYLGIELNPEYIKLAEERIYNELGMFS